MTKQKSTSTPVLTPPEDFLRRLEAVDRRPETEPEADLHEGEDGITMSKNRQLVALEAVWEIESLCTLLRGAVTPNDNMEHLAVRGLSVRIKNLACVVMSALSDESHPTSDLARTVQCEIEEQPA